MQILFLTAAVITCFFLAWWQWSRWRSGSGTYQNFSYALQWPLFAAFFIYAYRKYLQYEKREKDGEDLILTNTDVTAIDEDFLPARPQLDVETFNSLNDEVGRSRRRRREDEEQRF
ncbi:MAG: hypothetical protein Q3962_05955 [Corynebacterium sp.]|nr:hypothetical protein [Corynebacterium sp.]